MIVCARSTLTIARYQSPDPETIAPASRTARSAAPASPARLLAMASSNAAHLVGQQLGRDVLEVRAMSRVARRRPSGEARIASACGAVVCNAWIGGPPACPASVSARTSWRRSRAGSTSSHVRHVSVKP
jgi:hypothetical protein